VFDQFLERRRDLAMTRRVRVDIRAYRSQPLVRHRARTARIDAPWSSALLTILVADFFTPGSSFRPPAAAGAVVAVDIAVHVLVRGA